MARLSKETIERIKAEVDLAGLVRAKGVELTKVGEELRGRCPLHDDSTPSLFVNPKKNRFHCFGCEAKGSVIDWVIKAEGVSYGQALQMLHEGAAITGNANAPKRRRNSPLPSPVATDAEDHLALRQVVDFYHGELKQDTVALKYLEKRFIANAEMIDTFRVGMASRNFTMRLPSSETAAGRDVRGRLKRLGVLRQKSGQGHLNGCVTFPIIGVDGVVHGIYGRRTYRVAKTKKNQDVHWYLPGPRRGVWNEAALAAYDEVIVCESIIDALTFWCAGYRNVTSIYGVNGLTDDILDALKRHGVQRVLLAYDNDEAGNRAVTEHQERYDSLGLEQFRVRVSEGVKDINAAALLNGGGQPDGIHEALGQLLRSAQWLGSGKAPVLSGTALGGPSVTAAKEEKVPASSAQKASSLAASIPGVSLAGSSDQSTNTSNQTNTGAVGSPPAGSAPQREPAVPASDAAEEKEEVPVASPQPPAPKEVQAEVKDNGIVIEIGNRTYRVRGLEKNLAFDILKVNVLARRDDRFYVDTFDLYAAKARAVFIREAARELGFDPEVIKRDLGKVLLKLESMQDERIEETLSTKDEEIQLSDKDKQAALDLLKEPKLIEHILADFEACGVVGEENNKLVGYLAATSRKLDKPLAVVIQSSSAAGKSSLMDAVLRFVPPEEQVGYSAMTGQSLFYMGGMDLAHKILSIAEEEGVAQASYALKLLQSEGELTIASTGKDPGTGRMETQEYHVEGPVMIFLTTTAIDIDEELLNRCIVLTVDENRGQTRAIQQQQRVNETLDGMLAAKRKASVVKLHQNAQRLIRPLVVVNPYAHLLKFTDDCARRRRDHMKYLALIRSIALLHQYQRDIKTTVIDDETIQYVEVVPSDIALANRLSNHVLGNSIDELPPQSRRLLIELHQWVQKRCDALDIEQSELAFTRREVREALGWNQTQLCIHFQRLTQMDYLLVRRGGRGSTLVYELLYDGTGREGQPTLCGLIDVAKLEQELRATAPNLSGSQSNLSGPINRLSASNRPDIGGGSDSENNGKPRKSAG